MQRPALLLLPLAVLAACTTTAAPVTMARPLGTRQCDSGGPTPAALAAAMAQALREAGITVTAEGCGHDGRMRPAVCGAPDGRLAVVDIPADRQAAAEALGWRPLASLRDAQRQPC